MIFYGHSNFSNCVVSQRHGILRFRSICGEEENGNVTRKRAGDGDGGGKGFRGFPRLKGKSLRRDYFVCFKI